MHDTAYEHGRLFFQLYVTDATRTVVELGSQDVNGSLRDHCPSGIHYIGLDVMPARGVDLVVNPAHPLPLASACADAVVTSSAFEHDVCFWDTFQELIRILRPGGLLYLNAPSNGDFHRHPLDCWRFYPDAGAALVQSAARHGHAVTLLESFIGQPRDEHWADFVAVFRKEGGSPRTRKGRIADHVPAINVYDLGTPPGGSLRDETEAMPDRQAANQLRSELASTAGRVLPLTDQNTALRKDLVAATDRNTALSADLASAIQHNTQLSATGATLRQEIADLNQTLAAAQAQILTLREDLNHTTWQLIAIRNSTSWRMTAGLRRVMATLRGR